MKKLFIPIVAFVVLVCSCSKEASREESIDVKEDVEMVELSFTASTESTKALLDPDNHKSVSFSANDKIAIFKNGNKYEFTTEEGGSEAVFTGYIAEGDLDAVGDFYAIFPSSAAASADISSEGTITGVTLSKYSTATVGTFAPQQAIFVAKSSTTTLAFKSAVALLKITVPDGITDLKEIAIFNRNTALTGAITGIFSVTPGDGEEKPTVTATAAHGDPHTAGVNVASGTISPGVYYIPVLPSILTSGFDMKLTFNKSGDSFSGRAATGANLSFVAGKIYNLGTIKRERFFVIDGFENETIDVKSTKWTGNDVYVRSNPYADPSYGDNASSQVLEMDMHTRTETATSGYLDYSIPISSQRFKEYFNSLSVKVYYGTTHGKDDYYPRLLWNQNGTAKLPRYINTIDIGEGLSQEEFDDAMKENQWNTLTWTAAQFEQSDFKNLTGVKIRFFVDWYNQGLRTEEGYSLYACIDELTFYLK